MSKYYNRPSLGEFIDFYYSLDSRERAAFDRLVGIFRRDLQQPSEDVAAFVYETFRNSRAQRDSFAVPIAK